MTQENLEVMRRAMEAFNRRDGEGFDALLTGDAAIVPVRFALEGTIYRGAKAGTQYCSAVEKRWEDLNWDVEEMRNGDDWVLAVGHIRGQGRESGATIDSRAGWVAHLRDGLIRRFQTYPDRADALEAAARLSE